MKTKILVNKVSKHIVIHEWIQPVGFDLAVCCISQDIRVCAWESPHKQH